MKSLITIALALAASTATADICKNQKPLDQIGSIICFGSVIVDPPTLSSETPAVPIKLCAGSDASIGKEVITDRHVYRNLGQALQNCREGEQVVAYYQFRKHPTPSTTFIGYTFVPLIENHN
jgi:hypothetical protein